MFAWKNTEETGKPLIYPDPGCKKMRQRQPVVQWQPIIKPMRWQNSDEARAHLSTTRFHMQAAAPSSHRCCRVPVRPYQSPARSSGGEITRQRTKREAESTTGPPHEECPLTRSHAEGKYCHCGAPSGWDRKGHIYPKKVCCKSIRLSARACPPVSKSRCRIGLLAADNVHRNVI